MAIYNFFNSAESISLIEKNRYVGGRIKTVKSNNAFVDIGSQFFCKSDKNIWKVINKNNLKNEVVKLDFSNISFLHDNTITKLKEDDIELIQNIVEKYNEYRSAKDMISFNEWFLSNFEKDKLYIPSSIIRAITFSNSSSILAKYAIYILETFFDDCFTLKRGLGQLIESLSENLPLEKKKISQLIFKGNKLVELRTVNNRSIATTDKIIVSTIPPSELKIQNNLALTKCFSKIKFMGCTVIMFKMKELFKEKPDYIFITGNKYKVSVIEQINLGDDYFIGCLIPHPSRTKIQKKEIILFCKNFLSKIFGKEFYERVSTSILYEDWINGLPIVNKDYINSINLLKNIHLDNLIFAGDYTTEMPSMDYAVQSALYTIKLLEGTEI